MKTAPPRSASAPQTRRELVKLYARAIKKIEGMSTEERFDSMVRAGIYTRNGKLTKQYRPA